MRPALARNLTLVALAALALVMAGSRVDGAERRQGGVSGTEGQIVVADEALLSPRDHIQWH